MYRPLKTLLGRGLFYLHSQSKLTDLHLTFRGTWGLSTWKKQKQTNKKTDRLNSTIHLASECCAIRFVQYRRTYANIPRLFLLCYADTVVLLSLLLYAIWTLYVKITSISHYCIFLLSYRHFPLPSLPAKMATRIAEAN